MRLNTTNGIYGSKLSPGRQRREGFLLGFSSFSSLEDLFFSLGDWAKLGITQRFLVGIRWAVSGTLGRSARVTVRDRVAELTSQVFSDRRRRIQIAQTPAQSTHRLGKATLRRIAPLFSRGLWRPLCQLLFHGEQLRQCHRHDRPVQFGQETLTVTTTQLGAIERLLQAAKFDFRLPAIMPPKREAYIRPWRSYFTALKA
jgi:hypothetical protein